MWLAKYRMKMNKTGKIFLPASLSADTQSSLTIQGCTIPEPQSWHPSKVGTPNSHEVHGPYLKLPIPTHFKLQLLFRVNFLSLSLISHIQSVLKSCWFYFLPIHIHFYCHCTGTGTALTWTITVVFYSPSYNHDLYSSPLSTLYCSQNHKSTI